MSGDSQSSWWEIVGRLFLCFRSEIFSNQGSEMPLKISQLSLGTTALLWGIYPAKGECLSSKDSRFNRLPVCCISLTYLIDDIAACLEKYSEILKKHCHHRQKFCADGNPKTDLCLNLVFNIDSFLLKFNHWKSFYYDVFEKSY